MEEPPAHRPRPVWMRHRSAITTWIAVAGAVRGEVARRRAEVRPDPEPDS